MASIKVKFRPSTVEGKKGVIYYQVIQNRVIRQIHSNYQLHTNDWDEDAFTVRTDDPERTEELQKLKDSIELDVKRLEAVVGIIERKTNNYTADDIVQLYQEVNHKLTLFEYMKAEIKRMGEEGRQRTAETYTTTLYSISRFLQNKNILIEEVNPTLLKDYEDSLLNSGVTKNSTSFYMRILRATYNRAVKEGLVEQALPFKKVYTGIDDTVKHIISEEQLKLMKNLNFSSYPYLEFARDMFLLSFYTRGMSFIDLVFLQKTDFIEGSIVYRRHKNDRKIFVKWEPCMQEIVEKYKAEPDSPYVLSVLTSPYKDTRKQYKYTLYQINKDLKQIGEILHLSFPLTMNVARHSWASIAQKKDVDLAIISEGLGQKSEEATRLYLSSLENPAIDKANEKILQDL